MNKGKIFSITLLLFVLSMFAISCSTTGVSPSNYTRIRFINAIPGSLSLDCRINYTKVNPTTLAFPNATGYISTTPGSKNVTIVPTSTPSATFLDSANVVLEKDASYSLFFTGQAGTYKKIFTLDDLTAPTTGKAKIRFVNASLSATNLDITINAVTGFSNVAYLGVGKFIEVPAGTYEFKAFSHGTTNSTLTTLSNQTVADGKVYTLYAQGIVGNAASTSSFGLTLITNLLPAVK